MSLEQFEAKKKLVELVRSAHCYVVVLCAQSMTSHHVVCIAWCDSTATAHFQC